MKQPLIPCHSEPCLERKRRSGEEFDTESRPEASEGSVDKSGDPSVALLLQDDAMRQIASSLRSSQ
ncbi:MAG: hypothetical protein L0Y68_03195 [Candidatus Dadabacteria bacterium]|nr:hypothetical protein [Candidatus Dadabacteria bacterium]